MTGSFCPEDVSRPRARQRRLIESELVEERFASAGFQIVHPESLSFENQLLLSRDARMIAGPGGSAHHVAAFAGQLEKQIILTTTNFFLVAADFPLVMRMRTDLRYYFGKSEALAGVEPIEADWSILEEKFEKWLEAGF